MQYSQHKCAQCIVIDVVLNVVVHKHQLKDGKQLVERISPREEATSLKFLHVTNLQISEVQVTVMSGLVALGTTTTIASASTAFRIFGHG